MMTTNIEEASLARINIKNSGRVYALIDSSKFQGTGTTLIAPLTEVDTLITDTGIRGSVLESIKGLGVEVIAV